MFFGLNEAYMAAQELKISGFGTEFRDGAIGIGLRTQKYIKNIKKKYKKTPEPPPQRPYMLLRICCNFGSDLSSQDISTGIPGGGLELQSDNFSA